MYANCRQTVLICSARLCQEAVDGGSGRAHDGRASAGASCPSATSSPSLTSQWLANPPAAATKDDAEPLSAASDASLPDLARQDAASGEVKRQPTLREVAPGQHVRANSEAMPDDTDTAHPQLASCPSFVSRSPDLPLTSQMAFHAELLQGSSALWTLQC